MRKKILERKRLGKSSSYSMSLKIFKTRMQSRAVIRDEEVVGHMPRALASSKQGKGIVRHFLTKLESKGTVKAEGKAVNRGGGYGMEVACVYRFTGQQKYVEMLRNLLDLQNNLSVRNVHKTRDFQPLIAY